MPFSAFDPQRAVAIVLGAREFPKSISLELHGTRFSNSAFAFRKYLIERLGIPRPNVLDLFDDARSPDQLLGNIRDFLDRKTEQLKNNPLQDLLFYYVGHGFLEGRGISDLHLAIRQTDTDGLSYTALGIRSLATVIRSHARFVRRYLILDCCYGAAASRAWSQSDGPARLAMRSALDVFPSESPTRGTAVLSAAESDKEANALGKREFTAFSDGLLHCLDQGREELGEKISLESLHWMLVEYIRTNYSNADLFVRPKIESPEAAEGDVAWLPIFPNPAYRNVQEITQREEAERRQAEIASQQREEAERRQAEIASQQREEAEQRQAEIASQQREEAEQRQAEIASQQREEAEQRQAEIASQQREEAEQRQAEIASQQREEAERRQAQIARQERETQRKALDRKERNKAWLRVSAACFTSLALGICLEMVVSYVAAGSDWEAYYIFAGIAGCIVGAIYAFMLSDRFPLGRLHVCLIGGSWALGWIAMAHSGLDPLVGILTGAMIPLLTFVRKQK